MKSKYCFILTLIFLILFSLSAVTASENVTDDAVSLDDEALSDDADVSFDVDVEQVKDGWDLNPPGSVIPWTVTVNGTGGTVYDVEAHVEFSDNLEYVAHEATAGEYNSTEGIWDIGNLSSSDNASLRVWTKVLGGHEAKFKVTVTTNSSEGIMSNYWMIAGIEIYESLDDGPVSKPDEVPHNIHYPSTPRDDDFRKPGPVGKSDDPISHHISPGSIVNDGVGRGNATEFNPYSNSTSNVTSVSKSIINAHASPQTRITVYDYTQIPLLVFAIFLIALVAIVGVDRIKS